MSLDQAEWDRAVLDAAGKRSGGHSQGQRRSVYGSFWIDRTEFALPVDVIQEVVNAPQNCTPVPLSPPHVMGLFCLRKRIVPVIDLRVLLGFADASEIGRRKVAIIEHSDLCIGLLFDDTGGVINDMGASRVKFEPAKDGTKDVVIDGVLKLDDGKRLVQLLDPYELLKLEKLPRVTRSDDEQASKTHLGPRLNCISFQLGHTNCAIDLRYVQEITDVPEVHSSQLAHGHLLGNIELRGRTLPIVDFRGLLGNEPPHVFDATALKNRKLVILHLEEGPVGLLVYSINSIMRFYESDILPFANVALPRHDVVAGCLVKEADEIVILLDHARLLRDPALVAAAQSCQEIFAPNDSVDEGKDQTKGTTHRSSFILFSVEMPLAFDIRSVSEIIDRPKKLLEPPYALDFVDGIMNLRGTLITLINPRILYDLPGKDKRGEKILVVQHDSKKYGIIVDSIDEILTVAGRQLEGLPTISKADTNAIAVAQDVLGCVRRPEGVVGDDTVMVMDVAALIARCVEKEKGEGAFS